MRSEVESKKNTCDTGDSVLDMDLRVRVMDFLSDCAHSIDDDRLEEWPNFFSERGIYHITTKENEEAGLPIGIMYCEGRGMLKDRINALRTANVFEPHTYCHLLGNTRLSYKSHDTLSARTNFSVIRTMQSGKTENFAIGKYIDEIKFDQKIIEFTLRRVVLESRRVNVLLVLPL
ncbi:MAG: hypothetical protein CMM58_01810 [Rhodospirillaceae bacterium]|nr:hypothetical protein [Rhodospirillaceae bacterium]